MTLRRILAALASFALVGSLLSVLVTAQPASAADARLFNAGDIISDALFFDGAAMNASQVQTFLNGQVPTCRSGYTCLKAYQQSTPSRDAVSGRCSAYAGQTSESAATIIARVGAACGISQKVLLVLLEKEQSLVTDDWPESGQYRSATGYACPDTAACDSNYYGFFNQVYAAALQFKRYAANPTSWNHIAGQWNSIRFSPTASCGASNVFIQNQATAGLYNYTPYQPNAAALSNLYGTGDGCSAYGNRNFWRIYTDWFGPTTAGTSLLRTVDNPTVYIVAGTIKYPVSSEAMLSVFAPLGQVGFVSQQYLDQFATQQTASRILRSPGGTIYFSDAGYKLPFQSCGLVADYGGRCDTSGFVQLTDEQLANFTTGPVMTSILGTTSGARYYITAGTKREILDAQSQAAAGLGSGLNVLTDSAVSAYAPGAPIVRDGVYATARGTARYYYLGNNASYPVDPASAATLGLPQRSVGSLNSESIAKIAPGASSFVGFVKTSGSSSVNVVTSAGTFVWSAATTGSATPVLVPQSFVDAYPSLGTIVSGSSIKSPSSGTVYIVMGSKILPVGAWESLVALAGGKTPAISAVPEGVVSAIPNGPVALTSATLVRTPDNATVYLVNGITNKIAMSDFAFAFEAGVTAFSYTTQQRLDAYPLSTQLLSFGVTCGTTDYVAAGGRLHKVDPSLKAQYPFSYVPFDSYTCQLLTVGSDATPFIRTANGTIYYLDGGQKHPITSMATYQTLSQGRPWLDVVDLFASAIPTGSNA